MMNETVLGIEAGILTSIASLPQLIKVLKEKEVENISWIMLLVLIMGLGLWIWYGIMTEDWPVIISNSFAFLLNISLFVMYWIYKE